ncbi:MAG: hypothetical protein NC191_08115 [Muribaculaceae bacterium]|nr:hypothetical protein [Muribaculaceae bacterium]
MINFSPWSDDFYKFNKKVHSCSVSGGVSDARREAILRKLKQLAEKIKRLMDQLSMAKTPAEKNSIQIRIEQTQVEMAILERELNA